MEIDNPTFTDRDRVEEMAEAFLASYRAGRCPTAEEFADQYPEIADELRPLLQAMILLEQSTPASDQIRSAANGLIAFDKAPGQIGDYLVMREIGRGGMGVVYEAVQQSLGRQVALKVLSLRGLLKPAQVERFRREARAAARLHHNHIVPVFGFGEHEGTYYYAMQYVHGQSLDLVIQSLRQSRSTVDRGFDATTPANVRGAGESSSERSHSSASRQSDALTTALSSGEFSTVACRRQFYRHVARIGLQAAEALAYAHAEGVLHRDIKPSNLLLDAKGDLWITDFGLAKAEGEDELTHTGDFVGTLRYTAPERLEGWSDRRSDIYSLGVTLYELLTLRPFFVNRNRAELLRQIADGTPPPPRRVDDSIPLDLETIVLKAIAKEPSARYHRAEQMAEDLRRFLADRPILARRSTIVERLGRWCRRNPAIASLATTVVALLVTAVVILALSNAKIRRESAAKVAALKDREAALDDKDEALGQVWLYRGLYGMDEGEDETLHNFNEAIRLDPNNPDILWLRGFTLGGWARWDEALADMTKARSLLGDSPLIDPAARDWFVSMLYVAKGDRAAYQAACREALEKIESERNLDQCGTLLWMCTVTPYAVDDPSLLAEFAEVVLPPGGNAPTSDRLLNAGAALFRAGRFLEAQQRLQQAIQNIAAGNPTSDPMSEVYAHLFLAMTNLQLGLVEQAEAEMTEAKRLAKSITPSCWVSKLQHELLAEETQNFVSRPPTTISRNAPDGG